MLSQIELFVYLTVFADNSLLITNNVETDVGRSIVDDTISAFDSEKKRVIERKRTMTRKKSMMRTISLWKTKVCSIKRKKFFMKDNGNRQLSP